MVRADSELFSCNLKIRLGQLTGLDRSDVGTSANGWSYRFICMILALPCAILERVERLCNSFASSSINQRLTVQYRFRKANSGYMTRNDSNKASDDQKKERTSQTIMIQHRVDR